MVKKNLFQEGVKNLLFPYRMKLTVVRNLQELLGEVGMGMFISNEAESDEQLIQFLQLSDKIVKVLIFQSPPNVLYSIYFEAIRKNKTLDSYFRQFKGYKQLRDYYDEHGELPLTEGWIGYFIDLLKVIGFVFNWEALQALLTGDPAKFFQLMWNDLGNLIKEATADPMETLNILLNKLKFDDSNAVNCILHPEIAILLNPYAELDFAVITSGILLMDAYKLKDLSDYKKRKTIRRHFYYGTSRVITETEEILKEWIAPKKYTEVVKVPIKHVIQKAKEEGKKKLQLFFWHEGVKSDPLTIFVSPMITEDWEILFVPRELRITEDWEEEGYGIQLRITEDWES